MRMLQGDEVVFISDGRGWCDTVLPAVKKRRIRRQKTGRTRLAGIRMALRGRPQSPKTNAIGLLEDSQGAP